MFKPPKYARLLDPREIPSGYLRKLFDPCRITDRDFRLAVAEAYRRYHRARDRWFKLLMKKELTQKGSTPAMKVWEAEIEIAADGVLWLIGGLLGKYDEHNNARAIAKMQKYLGKSRSRAKREERRARLRPATQISGGRFQMPFSLGKRGKSTPERSL